MSRLIAFSISIICFFSYNLFSNENSENVNSPVELFVQANEHYLNENYSTAIDIYEDLVHKGFKDEKIFFNLGNSYFRLGHIAAAILNYERAKKLNPFDADIDFNLRIANLQIIDKIEPIPSFFLNEWLGSLIMFADSHNWTIITIVFLWLAIISLFLFIIMFSPFLKKSFFALALMFFILTATSFAISYQRYGFEQKKNEAIIFVPSVYIKSSPDDSGVNLFMLHEGTKVKILDELGQWRKIEIADGNQGWLTVDSYVII